MFGESLLSVTQPTITSRTLRVMYYSIIFTIYSLSISYRVPYGCFCFNVHKTKIDRIPFQLIYSTPYRCSFVFVEMTFMYYNLVMISPSSSTIPHVLCRLKGTRVLLFNNIILFCLIKTIYFLERNRKNNFMLINNSHKHFYYISQLGYPSCVRIGIS